MTHIGQKVKAARKARGIRQADLARSLGWHRQQINHIESASSITTRSLEQIAQALAMSMSDVLAEAN